MYFLSIRVKNGINNHKIFEAALRRTNLLFPPKGSKATWLRWGGKQKVEQEVESETGEVEVQETFISRFKWLQVFNLDCVDDTNSDRKIAEFIPPEVKDKELILDSTIEEFLKNIGSDVRYGGNEAFYDRKADLIGMPHRHQFSSKDAFYATRFHEEGHRTGHRNRLNRQLGNNRHGSSLPPRGISSRTDCCVSRQ